MKIPNLKNKGASFTLSLARIVSEDSQRKTVRTKASIKSSKDS